MTFLNQLGESGDKLAHGVSKIGLSLSELQLEQLAQYACLLQKWGRVYNLTANKEFSQIVSLHLLDSLVVVNPLLREAPHLKNILDVGSGAGLPGVVLAIALPHVRVHCVDAVAKKAAFIHQVAISLELKNLSAHHSRIEVFEGCYDLIASRAFSSLVDFVALTRKNISQSGIWLAMKARVNPEDEGPLPEGVELFHVEPLRVPDLEATRSIVWLKNKQ